DGAARRMAAPYFNDSNAGPDLRVSGGAKAGGREIGIRPNQFLWFWRRKCLLNPAEVAVSGIFICGAGAVSPAGWGVAALREALARGEPPAPENPSGPR